MGEHKNTKLLPRDYQVMHIMRERWSKVTRKGALTISQQTLAESCDCCVRTLQSSLERLKARGYIAWEFNYRTIGRRNYRTASSYYLLKEKAYNLMAWINRLATRKPRKPLQSPVVHATACLTKTDIYKKNKWTAPDLCGLGRDQGYISAILGLPDR